MWRPNSRSHVHFVSLRIMFNFYFNFLYSDNPAPFLNFSGYIHSTKKLQELCFLSLKKSWFLSLIFVIVYEEMIQLVVREYNIVVVVVFFVTIFWCQLDRKGSLFFVCFLKKKKNRRRRVAPRLLRGHALFTRVYFTLCISIFFESVLFLFYLLFDLFILI